MIKTCKHCPNYIDAPNVEDVDDRGKYEQKDIDFYGGWCKASKHPVASIYMGECKTRDKLNMVEAGIGE